MGERVKSNEVSPAVRLHLDCLLELPAELNILYPCLVSVPGQVNLNLRG